MPLAVCQTTVGWVASPSVPWQTAGQSDIGQSCRIQVLIFGCLYQCVHLATKRKTLLFVLGIFEESPVDFLGHRTETNAFGDDEVIVFRGDSLEHALR